MTRTHVIELPYLSPPLSANQRMHWSTKGRVTREVRHTAAWLARYAKLPSTDRLIVTLHYRPASRRRRDAHNLYPTVKALVDGLVDAGIVPDDDIAHVSTPEPVIHSPSESEGAAMWLSIDYPDGIA